MKQLFLAFFLTTNAIASVWPQRGVFITEPKIAAEVTLTITGTKKEVREQLRFYRKQRYKIKRFALVSDTEHVEMSITIVTPLQK